MKKDLTTRQAETMKKYDTPDLLGTLKPRRGRPPKAVPSKKASEIADDFERRGKQYLEIAKIMRGQKTA